MTIPKYLNCSYCGKADLVTKEKAETIKAMGIPPNSFCNNECCDKWIANQKKYEA